jgi:hypothetical protein
LKSLGVIYFAFPQSEVVPPQLSDLLGNLLIAVDIRIKFMLPELDWVYKHIGPFVPLPKTSMNKNNRFVAGENNTRLSRQLCICQPEPLPHTV